MEETNNILTKKAEPEKKADKLETLKVKHEKAAAAAQKAADKAKKIQDEINAEEQKRRDKEILFPES